MARLNEGIAYAFRGNLLKFQNCTDAEVMLSGPSETGKTIAILYRLHQLALRYPLQAAILRKVQEDIYGSVLQTYKKKILGADSTVRVYGGEKPQFFDYPTGARIWVAGMDKADKVLSAEFDIIYVNQAEELDKADWEILTTRTTGRAGNMPFASVWGDCNPRNSGHWILERAKSGLTLWETTHKDNPSLYDDDGELTEQGKQTIMRLSRLTGARLKRLFKGEWVSPEGTIYQFDRNIHVKHRDFREFTYWALSLDEGFTNPAVTLLLGIDSDLRVHVFKEFYKRGILTSRHVRLTTEWAHQYKTRLIVVDAAAAGLIAELANYSGLKIEHSKGHVKEGIDLVRELLVVQPDKRPRLTVEPECVNTINEFESYVYRKGTEDPLKEDDHSMDCVRNFCFYTFASEDETNSLVYDPVTIGPDL